MPEPHSFPPIVAPTSAPVAPTLLGWDVRCKCGHARGRHQESISVGACTVRNAETGETCGCSTFVHEAPTSAEGRPLGPTSAEILAKANARAATLPLGPMQTIQPIIPQAPEVRSALALERIADHFERIAGAVTEVILTLQPMVNEAITEHNKHKKLREEERRAREQDARAAAAPPKEPTQPAAAPPQAPDGPKAEGDVFAAQAFLPAREAFAAPRSKGKGR